MGLVQDQLTLATLSAVSASGQTGTFNLSGYKSGMLILNLTAVTGTTPVLTPTLQASLDGATAWTNVPTSLFAGFAATSGTGAQAQWLPFLLPLGLGNCRLSYTISGTTPSFTGTLVGILNKN
jgi:hypothetical protein